MNIINAEEAVKRSEKGMLELEKQEKFCEVIDRLIKEACDKGERSIKISDAMLQKKYNADFYKDILIKYGYEVEEKLPIFCDPTKPTEEIITIRW